MSPEGSIVIEPSNIDTSFGDNVTFICSSLGGPYNQYEWTHLETDNIVSNEPQLTISSVSFGNVGNYQCEVSNMAGNDIAVSSLNSKSLHRLKNVILFNFISSCHHTYIHTCIHTTYIFSYIHTYVYTYMYIHMYVHTIYLQCLFIRYQ